MIDGKLIDGNMLLFSASHFVEMDKLDKASIGISSTGLIMT